MKTYIYIDGDLVEMGAAGGGVPEFVSTSGSITEVDGWRYHTFNSSGSLVVSSIFGNPYAELLIVGAGGGGGDAAGGGGGGGGVIRTAIPIVVGTYTITVGAGGAINTNGQNTTISGPSLPATLTALGGGAGGRWNGVVPAKGGSGGGGGSGTTTAIYQGADPEMMGTQGYKGGATSTSVNYASGGGGGAGGVGLQASGGVGGAGGPGLLVWGNHYAGGGGGGSQYQTAGTTNVGGIGGGGRGQTPSLVGTAGTANTGGGGGGGYGGAAGTAGAGGSGKFILRVKI